MTGTYRGQSIPLSVLILLTIICGSGCGRIVISAKHQLVSSPAGNALSPTRELDATWAPYWTSLVGLWHLNEPAGSTAALDSSSFHNDGVNGRGNASNNATFGSTGFLSSAASFVGNDSGTDQFIAVAPSASLTTTSELTLVAWVYMPALPSGAGTILRYGVFSDEMYGFHILSNGQLYYGYNDGTTYYGCPSTGTVSATSWQHVALVRDVTGTNIQFYINGVGAGTCALTVTQSTLPTSFLAIGATNGNTFQLVGSLDEVAIWRKALLSSDIAMIYSRQSGN